MCPGLAGPILPSDTQAADAVQGQRADLRAVCIGCGALEAPPAMDERLLDRNVCAHARNDGARPGKHCLGFAEAEVGV